MPEITLEIGYKLYVIDVTTPKFPPPPFNAQKRSACWASFAVISSPSAVTISYASGVVAHQTAAAHKPADAASERKAGNARRGDQSACGREAVRLRMTIELAPCEPGLRERCSSRRIDREALHLRDVNHEAVIDKSYAGDVVPTGADRRVNVLLDRKAHCCPHIVRT
jgi:hypothetical protein